MSPLVDQPLESLAVRWQQRSASAAGLPSPSRNITMFWPSSVKGCGPSSSASTGTVAYQKRRRTFCLVHSIASARGCSSGQTRHDARRVTAQSCEVNPWNLAVVDDDATADDQLPRMGIAPAGDRSDERIVQAEIARMRKVEDREIGKLAGRDRAGILEA